MAIEGRVAVEEMVEDLRPIASELVPYTSMFRTDGGLFNRPRMG